MVYLVKGLGLLIPDYFPQANALKFMLIDCRSGSSGQAWAMHFRCAFRSHSFFLSTSVVAADVFFRIRKHFLVF